MLLCLAAGTGCQTPDAVPGLPYTTYSTFEELVAATEARLIELERVTSPGTAEDLTDHGFSWGPY